MLWWGMFGLFTLVLLGVVTLWVYAMLRNPKRQIGDVEARRIQNRWIVGGGILLPVGSIVAILIFGIPAGHRMLPLPPARGEALRIDITARQWQWDVHYPGAGIDTVNELHIPAQMPVDIHLRTEDVIHSFWVPRLAGKLDAIPGRINILRLEADRPGVFGGQCAEFCGLEHAHMKLTVTAHAPDDYERWLRNNQP